MSGASGDSDENVLCNDNQNTGEMLSNSINTDNDNTYTNCYNVNTI